MIRPDEMILSQMIFESWEEMKEEERDQKRREVKTFVDKLYESMPKRVAQIIERRGKHSNY